MFAHQFHLLFLLLLAAFSLFHLLLILYTFLMKIAFLVLILVLVFRPSGLMGEKVAERP